MRYLILSLLFISVVASAQKKTSPSKYNSLLWEITGNGIKKPAYLFGTMHVSSKLAFNLSDTFYNKLKSVDAVALETDPTTWQDDFQHSIYTHSSDISSLETTSLPEDYITKSTFQFAPYDKALKASLANDPYIINSFLYRNFNGLSDFEEATYLDMHIYQCGRKLFKPIYGLENFDESEKIMISAYKAQAGEIKHKSHSKEVEDENNNSHMSTSEKIEDAYRKGDLDLMDSLDKKNETSDAFNELFLYKRNEIQAFHIDSLLKTGISIFAGVGAAHLPGDRGVIEMLRKAGYTLTPVIMGLQSPKLKEEINKVRLPVTFSKQIAEDSMYSVLVPGKLYSFSFANTLIGRQWIHADFGNGSYYTISRLSTGGGLWGNDEAYIYRKIDSVLYENIPGKILERTSIKVNGINGFNIVNRTSKSNIQRYNIFVIGSEVIIFKMSGNEDYVQGPEAEKFFSSIVLKPRNKSWKTFLPENHAFSIELPDAPITGDANADNDGSRYTSKLYSTVPLSYECTDTATGNFYYIFCKSVINHNILEEDTFNLALASESFITSGFINDPTYRKQFTKGNPYIETKGNATDGSKYITRVYLKGSNYYTLIAKYNKAEADAQKFMQSFHLTSFQYQEAKEYTDSAMFFTVKSPVIPDSVSKAFLDISRLAEKTQELDRRTKNYEEPYWKENMKVLFRSKTTNEIISVSSRPYPKYYFINDSADFWQKAIENIKVYDNKSKTYDLVEKKRTFTYLPDRRICDVVIGDTGSSQIIKARWIIYNGRVFLLRTLIDSSNSSTDFVNQFYYSFTPLFDSSTNFDLFKPKSDVFFKDFYSTDSAVAKFARKNLNYVRFVEADIPDIIKAIKSLGKDSKQKDYLNYKVALIKEMGYLKKDSLVADKIKTIYDEAIDTATIQNEAVLALARLKQQQSYTILKNILVTEPPVFDKTEDLTKLFDFITDSSKLAKTLLPDILTLNSFDDYKRKINFLLSDLIDSNQITGKDYESIFNKLFFDAKIELKKLMATDEKLINKSDNDEDKVEHYKYPNTLKSYCNLLVPFWNSNAAIPAFFNKLLKTRDNTVKLNTVDILIKNKHIVNDSIITDICKEEKYLAELYSVLKKDSAEALFPAKYRKQDILAKSLLVNSTSSYNKKDSIEYLNKYLPANHKGKKGNVYFFKYKSNEKDADWKLAVVGIQPENLKEINADETIVDFTSKILKTNQPLDTQLKKLLKEQMYSLRKSSSRYFGNGYNRSHYDF